MIDRKIRLRRLPNKRVAVKFEIVFFTNLNGVPLEPKHVSDIGQVRLSENKPLGIKSDSVMFSSLDGCSDAILNLLSKQGLTMKCVLGACDIKDEVSPYDD
jgi:hypothetical protein